MVKGYFIILLFIIELNIGEGRNFNHISTINDSLECKEHWKKYDSLANTTATYSTSPSNISDLWPIVLRNIRKRVRETGEVRVFFLINKSGKAECIRFDPNVERETQDIIREEIESVQFLPAMLYEKAVVDPVQLLIQLPD